MNKQNKFKRQPLKNFFIKPGLQIRLTIQFVIGSFFASFCSLALLFAISRFDSDGLEGLRTAWYYLQATYSGFGIAACVSLLVGMVIGTYASRKVALPIFKVEQWAEGLKKGDFTVHLGMRDSDYWQKMANTCNGFTSEMRENLKQVQNLTSDDHENLKSDIKKIFLKYKI